MHRLKPYHWLIAVSYRDETLVSAGSYQRGVHIASDNNIKINCIGTLFASGSDGKT